MDIGTAKPTAAEQAEVRHHLIDLADPDEDFTVARYQRAFQDVIEDIEQRGRRAVLVGGTGRYLRAVVDDLIIPGQYPDVWAELDAESDTPALHRRLQHLDPTAASRMEPTNRRRVLRALEVTLGSGAPFSTFGPGLAAYPPSSCRMIGIDLPHDVVAARIERRFQQQLAAGLLSEVEALAGRPQGLSRTAKQALGYKELLSHLAGERTLHDALEEAARRTRRFARRQRSWFRRDPRIEWLSADTDPLTVLPSLVAARSGHT
jgi:tRNA dimethylallyltransferase